MEHIETLDRDPDFERPIDPRRKAKRNLGWPLLMIGAVAVAAFLTWRSSHTPEAQHAPPVAATPAPAASPAAPATPHYPIEAAATAVDETPLPTLADSDAPLHDVLAALFGGTALERIFHLEQIVPRFVATIDNLPRQTVALSRMVVKPIGGSLETASSDGRLLLRADNAERYAAYLRVMDMADTQKLVQTYVRWYPLFQKSYEELGYPNGYFNDRLVEVIDHLLATPDVPAPVALVQPKVLYEFADPALESRSAGQKILMRVGPVNEARIKAKLRDIRRAVTGQPLPR